MSDSNIQEGKELYLSGDSEVKDWFHLQLKKWPIRVDPEKTTNISFLYGAVLGFRERHGSDPEYSDDFQHNVRYLDKHSDRKKDDKR